MKRVIGMCLMITVGASGGCLKQLDRSMSRKVAVQSFMDYGPMEFYGARCDHALTGVPYAEGEEYSKYLLLDVYWNEHKGLAPMVVNVHGGGWEIGDKDAPNSVFRSKYLAGKGYVAVNVNYRMLPAVPIQTQVEDVMGAVIWAKENAARFGGDPARVGITGGSAGGHLTAMVAWASGDPYFTPTGHADSQYDSNVKAAAPFYGVFDLENTIGLGNEDLVPASSSYFLKTSAKAERAEIFGHVSPKNHLRPGLAPTFFVCGTKDEFNLYVEAVAYHEKLLELGVPTGLYTAADAPHGFDSAHGEQYTKEAMEATAAWFDRYLK